MNNGALSEQLRAYRAAEQTRAGDDREREIKRHLPLVYSVVDRIAVHLPPTVDREDLFHAGVIGLMDAIERFDPGRDHAFSTYAVLRIRGQVIDELRARDWVPRGARAKAKEYQRAVDQLSAELGRLPTSDELAAHLGISEDTLHELEQQAQLATQVSIDAQVGDDLNIGAILADRDEARANPMRNLEREDLRRVLRESLEDLKEQERLVIKLYYFEQLLMKEIAQVLGVTESRICQIHSRVINLLRNRLQRAELV